MASQHVKESTVPDSVAIPSVSAHAHHRSSLAALVFGALGAVFGDIGTSPLYTLKECLHAAGGEKLSDANLYADLFGILSLMFWALFMVVTVKYLTFVMRAHHHGEGGIFALLAVVPDRFRSQFHTQWQSHRHGPPGGDWCFSAVRRWRDHPGDLGPERG